jgi:DNA-binding MarR family transcriptional regulator
MERDPINRLGFLLHDSQRLMRKRFDAKASTLGLSSAQWRLMVSLVKEEGVAQARLAELLEVEPISVSRLLDRMEEGGWVERRADAKDRRVRMVFPTAKSREAFAEIKGMAGEVYADALRGLSGDEQNILVHSLSTIVSNLSDDEQSSVVCINSPEGTAA